MPMIPHSRSTLRSSFTILLACGVLVSFGIAPTASAQDKKAVAVVPAPSAGKAMICIYRASKVTGSASRDDLYVNRVFLARLESGEYAFTEVSPGTVVVSGLLKMTYGGLLYSSAAALNEILKKENERIRVDVEAGKTYYLKWASGPMASGIKVTLQEPAAGAKEIRKLQLSTPPKMSLHYLPAGPAPCSTKPCTIFTPSANVSAYEVLDITAITIPYSGNVSKDITVPPSESPSCPTTGVCLPASSAVSRSHPRP